ncbi:hypothetical protein ACIP6T_25115, partial [Pantoea sp. NPDC088449]|uniref:hypothetical protein n=1 Tax=Pantoea sp. NPDC088449 TaxID=3364392 RepID=UPI00381B6034
ASSGLTACREVAYITLSLFRVKHFFQRFHPAEVLIESSSPTPHFVNRCAVLMDAHYRELFSVRNR